MMIEPVGVSTGDAGRFEADAYLRRRAGFDPDRVVLAGDSSGRSILRTRVYADPQPGWTYAIASDPFDGWVKLGRSRHHPRGRLGDHQVANARRLVLRAAWPVDVENGLLDYFAPFRGIGEWFALPSELLRDMARFADLPEPWVALAEKWPEDAVWRAAGPGVHRDWSAQRLARAFMSIRAAKESGEEKIFTRAQQRYWRPTDAEREQIAAGGFVVVDHFGTVGGCRVVGGEFEAGRVSSEPARKESQ